MNEYNHEQHALPDGYTLHTCTLAANAPDPANSAEGWYLADADKCVLSASNVPQHVKQAAIPFVKTAFPDWSVKTLEGQTS